MEKYYIAIPEYMDAIYMEWGMSTADLLAEMEEASAEQIAEYGTYD